MIAAIQALEKGAYGMTQTEFIQQRAGADAVAGVKTFLLSDSLSLPDHDRETLASFLSEGAGEDSGYTPQSGEIIGILKQMLDTADASKDTCTNEESSKVKTFKALLAAKLKEIDALTKLIESKIKLIGELEVKLVNLKEQLTDEEAALVENKKLLGNIDKICDAKKKEYELRVKTRGEEVLAIADTIKILNDDDALDLFKKTLPSASLMQLPVRGSDLRKRALILLQRARNESDRPRRSNLSLLILALNGKKVSMTKVIKMIDDMVALLKEEQLADDNKKEYCEVTIDHTEDSKKELEHDVSDLSKAIEDMTSTIATLGEEIVALKEGIVALDKSVAEATEQRKEENEDYTALMASNTAALQLLELAKNRLNEFYNPKLYKPPPKRELTEEERITLNNGGTLAPTAAPGGIAGTGVEVFAQRSRVAPPPPPETFGAYAKKGEESGGVIAMLDMMIADLDKEITEVEVEEKEGQKEYEQFMADSAEKRALDAKSIEDKEGAKADLEAKLLKDAESKTATMKEAMATHEFLADTHADCDWLLNNFEARKQARAGEIDALTKGKAVLSGADFSLLQKKE